MPTKKDLAALLSETAQPPLRRGRGLRLSRVSKQARETAAKPSTVPEPAAEPQAVAEPELSALSDLPSDAPPDELAESDAPPIVTIEATESLDPQPLEPERDKRKLLLRKDLLKQCKRIARAQDRKLYQVIESALEEYIQRHGAPE